MQFLPDGADHERRLSQGDYVARRLRRARLEDLLATVLAATNDLETAGTAWKKARRAAFAAQADRDGVDDELDELVKNHRAGLAGRGSGAMARAPYTLIYPHGIDYYAAAPLNKQVTRYQEFADRLRAHLAEEEEALQLATRIEALLVDYEAAEKALEKARRGVSLTGTDLDAAEEGFDLTLERIHGALKSRFDSRKADRFFPRYRSSSLRGGAGPTDAAEVTEE